MPAEGIDFCYLDGSTSDRGAVVEQFQNNAAIPVFLISLKAGGVGLNLTGADTVIHFDPWWNPAVEDQATDRAHRIGQTKVVTSYKLIARDTVEEKILLLQNRKRETHPRGHRRRGGIRRLADLGGNPGTAGLITNPCREHTRPRVSQSAPSPTDSTTMPRLRPIKRCAVAKGLAIIGPIEFKSLRASS